MLERAIGPTSVELRVAEQEDTTPGVGVMVRELACAGGVVITASHNPIAYNGVKLLLDNGVAPPAPEAEKIKQCFLEKRFALADSAHYGP
jgi:phosphomannomutase